MTSGNPIVRSLGMTSDELASVQRRLLAQAVPDRSSVSYRAGVMDALRGVKELQRTVKHRDLLSAMEE